MTDAATPPGERPTPTPTGQLSISRPDLLLALIPLSFTAALLAATALEVPTLAGLTVAGSVGFAAIVHGIYVDPPIGEQ